MKFSTIFLSATLWNSCLTVLAAPAGEDAANAAINLAEDVAADAIAAAVQVSEEGLSASALSLNDASLGRRIAKYRRTVKNELARRGNGNKCNSKTVTVRKEW